MPWRKPYDAGRSMDEKGQRAYEVSPFWYEFTRGGGWIVIGVVIAIIYGFSQGDDEEVSM
jgi:hypothetical protein